MTIILKKGEELDVRAGAPWIYDNEIAEVREGQTGAVAEVLDQRGRFVARGFYHGASKIALRVLTRSRDEAIDRAFFRRRLAQAWEYRRRLGFDNACRVVFGESDGLPGLTVDKFGGYLSFQITSYGLEQWKPVLIDELAALLKPRGIYERDDVPVREKEGLPQLTGCVYGAVPDRVEIREHDAWMYVDIPHGQKTGHFLDQQENRGRLKPYVPGQHVLDLCCCSGGFAIHAMLYGAASAEAVDVSEEALALTRENAARNGVSLSTTCGNVFDLAHAWAAEGRQYGVVVLDPPAFAKNRRALDGAYRGYKELNLRAMQMVQPGGFLLTCSCSQFMTPPLFSQMLAEAAADLRRPVRLVERLQQSRDHPALLTAGQSLYLKGEILQVL